MTFTEAAAVQPFAVSVTVTAYVAGLETELVAVVGPLLQLNVVPATGLDVAVSV